MLARASIILLILGAASNPMIHIQSEQNREPSPLRNADLRASRLTLPTTKEAIPRSSGPKAEKQTYARPLVQVVIKPSNSTFGTLLPQAGELSGDGLVFMNLIATAYQTPFHRVINQVPPVDGKYDVSVVGPKHREDLLYLSLQQAVEATFRIRTRRETREMDVSVLRRQADVSKLRPSRADAAQQWFVDGKVHAEKQSVATLADVLENFLDRPVVDETELEGEYDWEFSYSRADEMMLMNAVRDELGLELVPGRRLIEVLVVEESD